MKLEDMLLVNWNVEGKSPIAYLSGLEGYLSNVEREYPGSYRGDLESRAKMIDALYRTKFRIGEWTALQQGEGQIFYARFCSSAGELKNFLQGKIRAVPEAGEPSAVISLSRECTEVLQAYGLDKNGDYLPDAFRYKEIDHDFKNGEILRGFNEDNYRILEVLNEKKLLLMEEKTGEILVASDTAYYVRTPKSEYTSMDSEIFGVQWQHGMYLGNDIMEIDFEKIKEDYAVKQQEEVQTVQRNAAHNKKPVEKGPKL